MVSFKQFLIEKTSLIKYGYDAFGMDDANITFLVNDYKLCAFQRVNDKFSKLIKIEQTEDNNLKGKQYGNNVGNTEGNTVFHDQLFSLFDEYDYGDFGDESVSKEDILVRGRLWIDPENPKRMMVSVADYEGSFGGIKPFFEKAITGLIPEPTGLKFAYEYDNQNIDFKDRSSEPTSTKKIKTSKKVDIVGKEKKDRLNSLVSQYHEIKARDAGSFKLKQIEKEIDDLCKELSVPNPITAFKQSQIEQPIQKVPSWLGRNGD